MDESRAIAERLNTVMNDGMLGLLIGMEPFRNGGGVPSDQYGEFMALWADPFNDFFVARV